MNKSVINVLFVVFVIANFFDALFTTMVVQKFGYDMELNPLIRWLMETSNSTLALWFWKAAVLVFLWTTIKKSLEAKAETFSIGITASVLPEFWILVLVLCNLGIGLLVIWDGYLYYTV